MTSAPEPHVIMPDGALSQVLAVAGDRLVKRVGLPWPFAGSTFATDGENVGCLAGTGPSTRQIDGLKMTTSLSWAFPHGDDAKVVDALAIADGRLVLCGHGLNNGRALLAAVSLDSLMDTEKVARRVRWHRLPYAAGPTVMVRDGTRLLVVTSRAALEGAHGSCVIDLTSAFSGPAARVWGCAVPDEELRSVHVAGTHLVILGGSARADALSFFDATTFAVRFRIIRDATIPRWTAALCVDDTLVVTDDRPGLMTASVDALAQAFAAEPDPDAGARQAARLLRATWRESPLGRVVRLERVPGRRTAIVVSETSVGPSASLWEVPT